jgi:hypothetical protein
MGATEFPVSRRGLALVFLAVAALTATAGWLRPPLSRDVAGIHVSLGLTGPPATAPETFLRGQRSIPRDSAGGLLLVFLAGAAVLVVLKPHWIGVVAGGLLCFSVAANAAVALNNPALVECMDFEFEQRQDIASALSVSGQQLTTTPLNGRVRVGATDMVHPGDPMRGWVYLLYERWLVLWAILGILLASGGPLRRRVLLLAGWGLLGCVLAFGVCFRRLRAEYYWLEAQRFEGRGDQTAARTALDKAVGLFPDFGRLERTWLLAGKLDFRAGRGSLQERYFRIYLMARDKERARGITYLEDLPSLAGRSEPAELSVPPAGFDFGLTETPFVVRTPDNDVREGVSPLEGRSARSYSLYRPLERRRALASLRDLMTAGGDAHPAVRKLDATLLNNTGLSYFRHGPVYTDGGIDFSAQDSGLMTARSWWELAAEAQPGRRDTPYYLGLFQARQDREHPEVAETLTEGTLNGLADRVLRADILNNLAQNYFDAGKMTEARRRYAASSDAFTLPEVINYRAQRGLGGF